MRYRLRSARDVMVFNLNEDDKDLRLSSHFVLGEFACQDGSPIVLLHPELPNLLEEIRHEAGGHVLKIAAYRTPSHNKEVGGKPNSKHLIGCAADITCLTLPPNVIADIAESINPGGLGRYDDFTHVDLIGINRRWDNRT